MHPKPADPAFVRIATEHDVPFLQRIVWTAILASPRFLDARGIEQLRKVEAERWAQWPQTDEVAWVAEDTDGRALGAVVLHVHERDGGRVVGYRLAIGVEEAARNMGIGRQLLSGPG